MVNEHPFQILFESLGRYPAANAEPVNARAYESLVDTLSVAVEHPGRCILLRAPRAGYGKTHLLSRVQHHLSGSHEFIPLQPSSGSVITAGSVIEDALRRLTRALPAAGGLTALDLLARKLFAAALQPLVRSGEVPCQDREGALAALNQRPIETFDFHHPNAVTAHWTRENFEVLGPRLSMELAQQGGLPIREVAFWVEAMFRFATTPLDHPARSGALAQAVFGDGASGHVEMERLAALLALVAAQQRAVLVADELEGFSADESAALKLSAFIGSLRQSVDRLDVIVSLNKDIWESAFVPRLSGGLADRLSEVVIELEPLTEDEMVALLESRAPGLGKQVLEHVPAGERHARALIRAAGEAWVEASKGGAAKAAVPPPAAVAAVAVEEAAPAPWNPPVEEIAAPAEVVEAPVFANPPSVEPEPVFKPFFNEEERSPVVEVESAAQAPASSPFFAGDNGWPDPAPVAAEPVFHFPPPPSAPVVEETPAFGQAPVFEQAPVSGQAPVFEQAPAFGQAPVFEPSSPFTAVVEEAPAAPEPPIFTPAENGFAAAPEPVAEAPAAWQFVPVAEPTPSVVAEPPAPPPFVETETPVVAAPPPPVAEPSNDRVDDLLRQFRERYGRGSL